MLTLDLSSEIETRLAAAARTAGRSDSAVAGEAISEYLDDLEDRALAAPVLERLRKGQEPIFTAAEVRRELGLAD